MDKAGVIDQSVQSATEREATRERVRDRAVTGTLWALAAHMAQQAIRLASNVVMSHFLVKADFGLMQLVNTVLRGLQMMSDVGVGPSIVQHERGKDPVFLQTAWTVQFFRSLALALIGAAVAYPIAKFLEPSSALQLATLIAVSACLGVIGGLVSTSVFTAARDMNIKRLTMIDLTTSAITLGAMVFLAWYLKSVWALVWGAAVTGLTRTILSHWLLPGVPHRFRWDADARKELFTFGRWIFLSTLLTFLALQSDRVVLQKVVQDLGVLGLYGIALQLATLPVEIAQGLSTSVIMPMYSRLKQGGKLPQSVFQQVAYLTSTMGGLVVLGMFGAGPGFIRTVYKSDYHDAALYLQLLAGVAWLRVLQNNASSAMLALGKPRGNALSNAIKLVLMVTLMPLGFYLGKQWSDGSLYFGLMGVLVGLTISELGKYLVLSVEAAKEGLRPFAFDLRATGFLLACTAFMYALHWTMRGWHAHPVLEMLASGVIAVLLYVPALYQCWLMVRPTFLRGRAKASEPAAVMSAGANKLRINFILPTPDLSGGVKSNRLIAQALVRRGHSVNIIHPTATSPWPPPWRVRSVYKRLRGEMRLVGKPRHHLLHSTANVIPVVGAVVTQADVPDADVTIGTWWRTMEWVQQFPASKGVHAYFVRAHELFGGDPARVRATYRLPAKKLVISNWLRGIMRDEYGDHDTAHIPNGVDWKQFGGAPTRGKQRIPTVGIQYSAAGFKDIATGLEALRLIHQRLPTVRVVTFGSDTTRAEHKFPPDTDFHLRPAQETIPELYRQADCWIICSLDEGFGMPGLEAAASRCPVVSTRCGGPEDYVKDGVSGYLVPLRDARAIADRVVQVLELSEEAWREMSDASYEASLEFDWDKSAEKLEKVLLEEVRKANPAWVSLGDESTRA